MHLEMLWGLGHKHSWLLDAMLTVACWLWHALQFALAASGTLEQMLAEGATSEAAAAHSCAQAWLELTPVLLKSAEKAALPGMLPLFFVQVRFAALHCIALFAMQL